MTMIKEPEKWLDNTIIIAAASLIIAIPLFENIIQPILISINPIFSYEYAAKMGSSGRIPDTPAGLALWGTCGSIAAIYISMIKPYLIDRVTEEN